MSNFKINVVDRNKKYTEAYLTYKTTYKNLEDWSKIVFNNFINL